VLWEQYQAEIVTVITLLVVQASVIAVLLVRSRKRNVEQRRAEDRYRNVVETQTDLVCRYLPDTTLTFVNDAYCRYFGRKREDLIGTKFIDLVPESERESTLQHVASLVDRPREIAYAHQVVAPDGQVRWQQWIDHVIVEADGGVSEIQGIGHDITDLKLAEREAQQHREQVMHLTRLGVLGELSGAIAHEINQPLTAILSNAQAGECLLEQESPDLEELRNILEDIVADDIRAGNVIRRLRALIKRGDADTESIDVAELVGEALALMHAQLLDQHIDILCTLPPDLPPVRGDRVQLLQLMLNLIMNACEAMSANPAEDRQLRVIAYVEESGDVAVSVIDNGAGITEHASERVFEPFFTTKRGGLGLGLSIARSIVIGHGGRLEVANNGKRGAVLSFALPPDRQDEEGSATRRPSAG